MNDPYATLGVSKTASDAEIKSAFRKKAMECHPDRNPGDAKAEQQFKEINAAYEVLKDPQKRAAFDRFGPQAFQQGGPGAGGFGGQGFPGGGYEFSGNFEDLFEDILGNVFGHGMGAGAGGGRKSRKQQGSDLRYNLEITLQQAFTGLTTPVQFPAAHVCETCSGSGAKPGTQPKTCGTCGGAGTVQFRQGFFSMSRTCPDCSGTGEVIADKCADCKGTGRKIKQRKLSVTVPPGVETGTRLRLTGEGEAGVNGGPAGDLYVFLHVARHPLYEREGRNLHLEVPLSLLDATLGTELELPTLPGKKLKVKVAPGTQPGSTQNIVGEGMPELGRPTRRGDLVLHYSVSVPQKLSKEQKALFEKLAETNLPRTSREESFLKRVKDLFK